jgi:hypothetical protein
VETLSASATPVFTDDSGTRAAVLQWVARSLCACCVLVGAAIAFTLVTHVSLPGLGGILAPLTTNNAPRAARDGTAGGERSLGAALTAASAGRNSPASKAQSPLVAASSAHLAVSASTRSATGSIAAAQPHATSAAAPASTATPQNPHPQSNANPHATTRTKSPHATAKSANSTARANPHATAKSANAHATARSANAHQSGGPTSAPPGATE